MILRNARPTDAAAIAALWTPIIRDTLITFTTEEKTAADVAMLIEARQAAGQGALVAEEAGTVLGFASYGPFRAGPGYRHSAEHTILLTPEARGRGVGRALMQALIAHATKAGIHALIGGVSGANPGAVAFHAALGFAEVGRLPQVGYKSGQWLDLVLMQRLL